MFRLRITSYRSGNRSTALSRTIATLLRIALRSPVKLYTYPERAFDRVLISLMAVAGQLHAIRESASKVGYELFGIIGITATYKP